MFRCIKPCRYAIILTARTTTHACGRAAPPEFKILLHYQTAFIKIRINASASMINKQFKLVARPEGFPKSSDWRYEESPVKDPAEGEVLLKTRYISIDPAMRGWMNESKSYIPPAKLGEVMRAATVCEVLASRHPEFAVGEHVSAMSGVQSYAMSDGKGLRKIDPKLAPLPKHLSVLGMTGMTAYFGFLVVGQPKQGDVVVVSAATGGVGSIVGQLAKIHGCRAVGVAGGIEKCHYAVNMLGFDGCIDYKRGPIFPGLARECTDGVDVYFDNVGGEVLDAVMARLRRNARVILCGAISQYNNVRPIQGPKNYLALLVNRARMEGFVVFDWEARYAEAVTQLVGWMSTGRLTSQEHIIDGIETFPNTLMKLFGGENRGKLMIRVMD